MLAATPQTPDCSARRAQVRGTVLFVIGSLEVGGAERQMVLLARELVARHWRVSVFSLDAGGPLADPLRDAGATVIDGGFRRHLSRAAKILIVGHAQIALYRIVRNEATDVVHGFLPLTNCMAAIAGRVGGAGRIVTSKRGLGTHQDRHPWWRPMDRLANRLSHVVVANAEAVRRDAARRDGVEPGGLHVIPNGVDTDIYRPRVEERTAVRQELGLAPTDAAVVCVANLSGAKGHLDLLEAFAPVARQRKTRLFLIGEDRGMAAAITDRIDTLGLQPWVTMLGLRHDVPSLMAGMDLALLPSHEEGCPNAVLEALACGLPVVATDVGDVGSLLAEVPDSACVPPRAPAALRCAIERALDDLPQMRGRNETRHRHVARRYSVSAMVDAHVCLYIGL